MPVLLTTKEWEEMHKHCQEMVFVCKSGVAIPLTYCPLATNIIKI